MINEKKWSATKESAGDWPQHCLGNDGGHQGIEYIFFYNVCAREIAHKLSPAKFGMNRKRLTHATKLNASVIEVLRSCINFIVPFLKVIRLIRPCIVVKKHPKLRFIWIDDH